MSRRQNEIAALEYDYPDGMTTVEDLLRETVRIVLAQYQERMDRGDFLTVLTEREIADRAASGKVAFGINYGEKKPNLEKSVTAALECFEDGMVALFVDGARYESLTDRPEYREGGELTFVRLIPLAGRMW